MRTSCRPGPPFAALANSRWNPNFANTTSGITDLDSAYHALQMGINRRMSNNLSAQVSYTYSNCTDISSGNWSQEGGTNILNPYDVDRGPRPLHVRAHAQPVHQCRVGAAVHRQRAGRGLAGERDLLRQFGRCLHHRRHHGAQQQPRRDRQPRELCSRCARLQRGTDLRRLEGPDRGTGSLCTSTRRASRCLPWANWATRSGTSSPARASGTST